MKNILLIITAIFCFGSLGAQTGLKISYGTQVELSGSINLVLNDMDIDNDGSIGQSGTPSVTFTGSTDRGIYSSDDIEFYNLVINKSAGGKLELDTDILVENNIEMIQGIFDIKGYLISLDGGQITGESGSNYITGTSGRIEYITILNAPDQETPGNLGLEITSVANLGQTVIRRGHSEQTSNTGGKSILRYFDINPVNNSGLNATLRIYYNDVDLNGIPEGELEPWRSTDNGSTWELQTGSLVNTTNNWVQLSGIDAFSRWTLASATTSSLPVELSIFKGRAVDKYNLLEWETLSENNVDYFEIQKLKNETWEAIDQVEAAHFTTITQTYSFKDFDINSLEYYRLRIIDYDDKEEYSEIISIDQGFTSDDLFTVYPNPAHNYLSIEFDDMLIFNEILIYDYSGKKIRSVKSKTEEINIEKLPTGIYFLEARFANHSFKRKITKL